MEHRPTLKAVEKTNDGRFLKSYRLEYETEEGKTKQYEIMSRHELHGPEEVGQSNSGVSVVVFCEDKMLLLKEYRMAVNDYVYNLVGGMLEEGETLEECVKREVFEETGLEITKIVQVLPPAFAAVAISDIKTSLVIANAKGKMKKWDKKENIFPGLYTRKEVETMIRTEKFAARCQMLAYYFSKGYKMDL